MNDDLATFYEALLFIAERPLETDELARLGEVPRTHAEAALSALAGGGRVLLQTILARCRSRTEVAVTFLATLELVRRREVGAEQDELFGPILVETRS